MNASLPHSEEGRDQNRRIAGSITPCRVERLDREGNGAFRREDESLEGRGSSREPMRIGDGAENKLLTKMGEVS